MIEFVSPRGKGGRLTIAWTQVPVGSNPITQKLIVQSLLDFMDKELTFSYIFISKFVLVSLSFSNFLIC